MWKHSMEYWPEWAVLFKGDSATMGEFHMYFVSANCGEVQIKTNQSFCQAW